MKHRFFNALLATFLVLAAGCAQAADLPAPAVDAELKAGPPQTLVVAGGCFWGIEAVFEHTKGVLKAVSGYAGGTAETAYYDTVSSGTTGHAEAVEITYDPAQVTPGTLLKIFFSVAHDPTQVDRQWPDKGTQYRSGIFTQGPEQEKIATAYIAQLDAAKIFDEKIATKVTALEKFYPAEAYHQDYAKKHPDQGYIAAHDAPKVEKLKTTLPGLYKDE